MSLDLDEVDIGAVLAPLGLAEPDGEDADQEEVLAEVLAARERDDAPPPVSLAGAVAQALRAGPGLAAWVFGQDPAGVSDRDAVVLASACRRLAAAAQARELALVAQIAARSAARDPKAGLRNDGRPAFVTRDAAAQVSLELVLSGCGAEAWTDLAVTLAWRLPATAAALAAGQIDLIRARILAEAVTPLSDEAAARVEAAVLPGAGDWTYAQLRAVVRRAVLAADPDGAEDRRQAAERRAKVSLYPDQDCTATLTGTRLPAAHAAAAMARLSAMAQAMKAAGHGGGLHLLRAQAYLGLLLGTLPLIPPPADGPPDAEPPDAGPSETGPSETGPSETDLPEAGPPDAGPPENGSDDLTMPGARPPEDYASLPEDHVDHGAPPAGPPGTGPSSGASAADQRDLRPGCDDGTPQADHDDSSADADGYGPSCTGDRRPAKDCGDPGDFQAKSQAQGSNPPPPAGPWADAPPLTDADLPGDDGWHDVPPPVPGGYADWDPDRGDPADFELLYDTGVIPPWPGVPSSVPPGPATRAGPDSVSAGRPPPGGLLDLTLPWATLTGAASAPGSLGRIGPVTARQARELARLGARTHATQWRVILTDPDGTAIAVARIPRPRLRQRPRAGPAGPPGSPAGPGGAAPGSAPVVGRVTVIISAAGLGTPPVSPTSPDLTAPCQGPPGQDPGGQDPGGVRLDGHERACIAAVAAITGRRILAAARRARDAARREADADQHAPGGCAHTTASTAYRPPPRIAELVTARDQTCRNPRCGQPAWRADLDHTRPHHQGGPTCKCNLGGACRRDHQLRQLPGWNLTQPRPGIFIWTTPAGLTYTARPDQHHAG